MGQLRPDQSVSLDPWLLLEATLCVLDTASSITPFTSLGFKHAVVDRGAAILVPYSHRLAQHAAFCPQLVTLM